MLAFASLVATTAVGTWYSYQQNGAAPAVVNTTTTTTLDHEAKDSSCEACKQKPQPPEWWDQKETTEAKK
jgi:hypothetical protein